MSYILDLEEKIAVLPFFLKHYPAKNRSFLLEAQKIIQQQIQAKIWLQQKKPVLKQAKLVPIFSLQPEIAALNNLVNENIPALKNYLLHAEDYFLTLGVPPCLKQLGWPAISQAAYLTTNQKNPSLLVGSETFLSMWNAWNTKQQTENARNKLTVLLKCLDFPLELTQESSVIQHLLSHFSSELAPDNPFWHSLASEVQIAFPAPLTLTDSLGKQIHQLRYLISLQQTEFIRRQKFGFSDQTKLAYFLRNRNFSLSDSDRLHQKKAQAGLGAYPSGYDGGNFKLLIAFHSEFIINRAGKFQNILDLDNLNGVVNGASFNYANKNDRTHTRLDVKFGKSDPQFRKKILKKNQYKAPTKTSGNFSYTNKTGAYAINGRSSKENSQLLKEHFKKFMR